MPPRHIAILGGGLTGLSSAFHLSRRFPASTITIIDKNKTLGGWASSTERVQLPGGRGSVVLEGGPRSLRPASNAVLELIHLLNLAPALVTTPTSSPAAKNRYLHVPGTPGIYALPRPSVSYLWNELRYLIQPGINFELVRGWNRPEGVLDESLESFLTRRGHPLTARVLGSALAHGIYAADARLLSVRAAFPKLWELEEKGNGRILWGLLTRSREEKEAEKRKAEEERRGYELGDVPGLMEGVSVYSFRDGMHTLADALARAVAKKPNVRVLSGAEVTALKFAEDGDGFEITTSTTHPLHPTHIVSALPLPALAQIIPETHPLPYLTTNPASSVTALNLVFPTTRRDRIFPLGFGYLVCRPQDDYGADADDAGILGVTFDSASLSAQDDLAPGGGGEGVTKVTVMLGGPHLSHASQKTPPKMKVDVELVLAHLQYHLNRARRKPLPQPLLVREWHNRDCIPTPLPGHLERMKKLREALAGRAVPNSGENSSDLEGEQGGGGGASEAGASGTEAGASGGGGRGWDGRMEVVGAGVRGVSWAGVVLS
ncbi:hypothetical protein B0H14DRAFT_332518 [Mycena olivaceomarginata]|nr:hypothetical protein B0H14DRAFT_332518 [Mycena olivaceomarginata]